MKPTVPTIDEMVARIGTPRNFAEQVVLKMIADERSKVAAVIARLEPDLHGQLEHELWMFVLNIVDVMETYRAHGQEPCVSGMGYPEGEVQT